MKNWLTDKPDLKALYFWVHTMSRQDKRGFSILFKPKPKEKKLYWQLYEGILQMEAYDDEEMRGLIPKKNFVRSVEALLEKLLQWQMVYDKSDHPRLYRIEKALEIGAVGWASKVLSEEINTSLSLSRYSRLLMISDWMNELSVVFGINLFYVVDTPPPWRGQLLIKIQEQEVWKSSIDGLKYAFAKKGRERQGVINHVREMLHLFYQRYPKGKDEQPDDRIGILEGRLNARIAVLNKEIEQAISHQTKVVEMVGSKEGHPFAERLQEALVLVHLQIIAQKDEAAIQTLERLRAEQPGSPLEETLKIRFIARIEMAIAERWWDERRAKRVYHAIQSHPRVFLPGNQPSLLFKIALIHFVNGNYQKTLRYVLEFNSLPSEDRKTLQVWAEFLELASWFSIEEFDNAERAAHRAENLAEKSGSLYAMAVARTLKATVCHIPSQRARRGSKRKRTMIHDLLEGDYPNREEFTYFNVGIWYTALYRNTSCYELIEEGKHTWELEGHPDEIDPARSMFKAFYPLLTEMPPMLNLFEED